MGILSWFTGKKRKSDTMRITQQQRKSLQENTAAVGFDKAGEHESSRSMIEAATTKRKILAIGREGDFSTILVEYSLEMAKRLNCELLALNVTDAPFSILDDEKREAEIESFRRNSIKNATAIKKMAENIGIPFTHIVEIGHPDEVIGRLHIMHPGMRYVLIEPDPEVVKRTKGNVSVPVFDLSCYSHAAV